MLKTRPSTIVCEQALIILTNLVKVVQQRQYVQTIVDLVPVANEAIQYLFVNLKVIEKRLLFSNNRTYLMTEDIQANVFSTETFDEIPLF
jgi:hypothetical protein